LRLLAQDSHSRHRDEQEYLGCNGDPQPRRRAAERAVAVGSGRVGRTKVLALEERTALAARATIRHGFTDYDDRLAALDPLEVEVDDFDYRTEWTPANGVAARIAYVLFRAVPGEGFEPSRSIRSRRV